MQARPRGPGLGGALVFSLAPGSPLKASARSCVRYGPMNAEMLQILIPIVAILAVFGFPVAMVFVWKWFKFKDKELQLDAEMRKTSGQALEARVQRLESVILALDSDLRAKHERATGFSAARLDAEPDGGEQRRRHLAAWITREHHRRGGAHRAARRRDRERRGERNGRRPHR